MPYLGITPASTGSVNTANMADSAVSTAKIAANAVTGAKFNADVISGQTELGVAPADTDEFLVSDAGVIKRIDYSLIKATSFTSSVAFRAWNNSDFSIANTTTTVLPFGSEEFDLGSNFASNQFTAPTAGKYFFYANIYMYAIGTKRFSPTFLHTVAGDASYGGQQLWSGTGDISSGAATSDQAMSIACIFSMTQNSTMRIQLYHDAGSAKSLAGTSDINTTKTTFGGFQIA